MKKRIRLLICVLILIFIGTICYLLHGYLSSQREKAELTEQVRQHYEAKYDLYRKENASFEDYQVDVAFLGDSLTDGYDLQTYFPQYVTANRGIGGETTSGLKNRLDLSAYALKPKVVVLLIGGNNLNTMFDDYEDILIGLRQNLPQTEIVILSLTAMGRDWAYKNHLAAYNNVKIKALAETYGCHYIDIFTPLLDPETDEIRAEYTNDGVHLTREGYLVLTNAITPVLSELLSQT